MDVYQREVLYVLIFAERISIVVICQSNRLERHGKDSGSAQLITCREFSPRSRPRDDPLTG